MVFDIFFSGNEININWSFTVVFTAFREIVKVNWKLNSNRGKQVSIINNCATSTSTWPEQFRADVCGDENVQFVELICNYIFSEYFFTCLCCEDNVQRLSWQHKHFWLHNDTECGLQFSASQITSSTDSCVHTHIKNRKSTFFILKWLQTTKQK